MFFLKDSRPTLLADRFTHSELQHRGSCSSDSRDTLESAKLSDFRARARVVALSQTEMQAEAIVPSWSPPLSQHEDTGITV